MISSNDVLQRIYSFLEKKLSNNIEVVVDSTASTITSTQLNYDDLNCNANLQIGEVDVGSTNPIPTELTGIADNDTLANATLGDRISAIFTLSRKLVIAGYDWALDSLKVVIQNPIWTRYTNPNVTIDTTNLSINTYYYPSSTGQSLDGYKDITIQLKANANVTYTVEAHTDDSVTNDWVDITKSGYDMISHTNGNTSFVNVPALLSWSEMNISAFRIKAVVANATNTVKVSYRLRY